MTDLVESGGASAPDANVSQTTETQADAEAPKTGNEAESSPAVKKADDEVTDKVRSRIDELTKYRREAERDRDYWRELAVRNQRQEPEPAKPAPQPSQVKTLEDFEYDTAKYQAHLFEQAEKRAVEAAERRLAEQESRTTAERRQSQFNQREQDFSKNIPDYLDVTRNPRLPITPHVAEAVEESEEGPALAYFLGKNIDVAERLAQLSPLAAARELGRIEARLISEREKAKEKSLVSKAPPPPPKIEAAGDPAIQKDPSQMSDAEFAKWRRRQIAQRR